MSSTLPLQVAIT